MVSSAPEALLSFCHLQNGQDMTVESPCRGPRSGRHIYLAEPALDVAVSTIVPRGFASFLSLESTCKTCHVLQHTLLNPVLHRSCWGPWD
jgi:hypothetical protein